MATNKAKIFGLGLSKTGTTSLANALQILGYRTKDNMGVVKYATDDLSSVDLEVVDANADVIDAAGIRELVEAEEAVAQPEIDAAVAGAADEWWSEHCEGPFVVGVNVRTGNGAYFGEGGTYAGRVDISLFEDRRRFLRLLDRACRERLRGLPKPLRSEYVVFYATDSAAMSELLRELPNAATRRHTFPPPGAGDLYAFGESGYSDRDSITDTLVDMFLLARCDALVYNSSLFNQYARVSTGYFGGNHVHFESLLLRKRARYLMGAVRRRLG